MTYQPSKNEMLIEALEYYLYHLEKDNCNQAAIDVYTDLLHEIEREELKKKL
jgi:23S rRNA G2069 N7-methylase RlmK/C1962 C5-methylase RlmI